MLAVLDECVELWLSSGLEEALRNNIIRLQGVESNYSADQLLESIRCIDEVDAFTLHASPTCCISALNTEIVPGTFILAIAFRKIIDPNPNGI